MDEEVRYRNNTAIKTLKHDKRRLSSLILMQIRVGQRFKRGKNTDLGACVAQSAVFVIMKLRHVIETS